jgi:putative transposase
MIAAGASMSRHPNGDYALWQRRFWEHTIRDEDDYARRVEYIHFNPLKHGLVSRVREWPYSSFHRYVRLGILPNDWAGDVSGGGVNFGER